VKRRRTTTGRGQRAVVRAAERLEPRRLLAADLPTLDPAATPSFGVVAGLEATPASGSIIGSVPVASLIAAGGGIANFHDPAGQPAGIAVTGFDPAAGSLSYSLDGGQSWQPVGEVSGRSALVLHGNTETRLAFRPAAGTVATLDDAITFRAWNRTGYANGATGVDTLFTASQVLAQLPTADAALGTAVTADGSVGLIAERAGGLRVISLTGGTAGRSLATVDLPGATVGVAISPNGQQAYTANDFGGLSIVNLTSPASPQVVRTVPTNGYAYGVAATAGGRYVFVAVADAGLDIVDLQAGGGPRVVRNLQLGGYALGVAASADGRYALVTNSAGTLQVIDAANPATAAVVRTVTLGGAAETVTVGPNGLAAVACGPSGIRLVSVANPAAAAVVGSLATAGYAWTTAFSPDGSTVYVANGSATLGVDVQTPAQPQITGRLDGGLASRGVAVAGDGRVLVADFTAGSLLIDASRPNSSSVAATTGGAKQLAVSPSGSLAFVADNTVGLAVVSAGPIGSERVLGTLDTGRVAVDVAVSANGRYAYVADTMTGLVVVDAVNPASPQTVAVVAPTNAVAVSTSADGSFAYVGDRFGGLYLYSLANPAVPQLIKTVAAGWPVADVAVNANRSLVAVAADTNGLEIFNVAVPSTASRTARLSLDGQAATAVAFGPSGSTAYAATDAGRLFAFDLTNPAAPTLLGTLDLQQPVSGLAVDAGGRLYAALGGAGVAVIDLTLPGRPLLLGTINAPGQAQGVAVGVDGRLLVAANGAGLYTQRVTPRSGFSLAADTVAAIAGGTIATRGSLALTRTATGWKAGDTAITASGALPAMEAAWQFLEADTIADVPTLFARHRSGTLHRLVADATWQLLGFSGIHNVDSRSLPAAARGEADPGGSPPVLPTGVTLPIELIGRTQLRRNAADELFADDTPLMRDGDQLTRSALPGRAVAAEALPEGNRLLIRLADGGLVVWRFDASWRFLSADPAVSPGSTSVRELSLAFGRWL